ncbi:hypothetical protein [Mesorhizobium sp. AA22]|uniref:hypothetical protein n=1 Tax=Mesorhizobium sp. AA22 TaxID=1854057 RepID=UPI0007ED9BA8|nr:hypothetical protein [Mesorhizobium sp. AA22]QIA23869.1 hypothetical protein A9K68_020375 [Mesorhizobium sp. AA22]
MWERLERGEINGAIHELVALTPRDAIAADANGEGEREALWCHLSGLSANPSEPIRSPELS